MLRITAVSANAVDYLLRGSGCEHEHTRELGREPVAEGPQREVERGGDAPGYFAAAVAHGEERGRWWGRGLDSLGLEAGNYAGDDDVRAIFGELKDPRTGASLGRPPRTYKDYEARVAAALAKEPDATPERRASIELEAKMSGRKAVAYYDLTFSPVKSVSVLYAGLLATGAHEQAATLQGAHDDAVKIAMGQAEKHAAYTRTGYHGRTEDGRSVGRYEAATGLVGIGYRHSTNRENEPQLHTHFAVLNRVETASDGVIRALDGRGFAPIKEAVASAYERTLEQLLGERLGVVFADRPDGKAREIAGVAPQLCAEASTRNAQVVQDVQRRVEEYIERHGQQPDAKALRAMAQAAARETRKPKSGLQGPAAVAAWGEQRVEQLAASVQGAFVAGQQASRDGHPDAARKLDPADRHAVLAAAVADVQHRYASWTVGNLVEAIERQVVSLPGPAETRPQRVEELAREVLAPGNRYGVLQLTAADPADVPAVLRRVEDGRSVFRPHIDERYATAEQLATEQRIVAGARQQGAPHLAGQRLAALREQLSAEELSPDQVRAVAGVIGSGRVGDVLIGPAGTGKSHTVGALARAWQQELGGRVLGLATSQIATQVLAEDGLDAINTSVFLQRFTPDANGVTREQVRPGDLYVVDESGMSSTHELAVISQLVAAGGGKLLYTGDMHQLAAVRAGGVLELLARDNGVFELEVVHRFDNEWEKAASARLRGGEVEAVLEYQRRGRLVGGSIEEVHQAAVRGYLADTVSGLDSLLLVGTNAEAADLAKQIRGGLVRLGRVSDEPLQELRDGNEVSVGDVIQARRNDPNIRLDGAGMVVNREIYTVLGLDEHGQLRVQRVDGTVAHLPAQYVAEHVTLAYASTVHGAQGRTVDTCHSVLDGEKSQREDAYVALTRGRQRNTAYLVTEREADLHTADELHVTPDGLLGDVLRRQGAEHAAELERRIGLVEGQSLAWIAGQWDDVSREYARYRYTDVLASMLPPARMDDLVAEDGYARLMRTVREAELVGHNAEAVIQEAVVAAGGRSDPHSISDVLRYRIRSRLDQRTPELAVTPGDWTALAAPLEGSVGQFTHELAVKASQRQHELGQRAAEQLPTWAVEHLGAAPADPAQRQEWQRRAGVAAAYRELAAVPDSSLSLGAAPSREQEFHRALWRQAATALGRPADALDFYGASEAELREMGARWQRELTWAPPYVSHELQAAHTAADAYRREAALAAAGLEQTGGGAMGRDRAEQEVSETGWLAEVYTERARQLEELQQARGQWVQRVEDVRLRDQLAGEELQRRGVDLQPPAPLAEQPALFGEPDVERTVGPASSRTAASELTAAQVSRDQLELVRLEPAVEDLVRAQPLRHGVDIGSPEVHRDEGVDRTLADARRQAQAAELRAQHQAEAAAVKADREARQAAVEAERARRDQAELDAQRDAEVRRASERELDDHQLQRAPVSGDRRGRSSGRESSLEDGPSLEL